MGHAFGSSCIALSLSSLVLACGNPTKEPVETTEASTGGPMETTDTGMTSTLPPETTSGGTTSAGSSSSSGADSSGDGVMPPLFDLGIIPDMPMEETSCSKVDFMFIIDNSSSMAPYQANLVSNFPAFISGIQGTLSDVDSYQVGVITTDPYFYNIPGCQQLSSLVVQTGGSSSSNMTCGPYADGYNFMTQNDDLATSFSCAAMVGSSGSGNEQPMQAMVEAVQRVQGGAGQCNEGFLRDDALLVIVYIGNEHDNSPGLPMDWYDEVVAAKLGIPENVVVVAISDYPGNPCGFGASTEVAAFTQLWGPNGFLVPFCVPDYGPPFQDAIGIIDIACENYIDPAG